MVKAFPLIEPEDAGFSSQRLSQVGAWLDDVGNDGRFHVAVARHGKLVRAWVRRVDPAVRQYQASAAKSLYSSQLGIAVADGRIPSLDAKVVDIYPEMMEVREGEGPKPGRYAFEKDREITFRQLICNCSGYMKPGEAPGKVFHYQTFGMNVLTHALAKAYGLHDTSDPELLPACGKLIEDKIRNPIGAGWIFSSSNFNLPPQARIDVFGNGTGIFATAEDMLRIGTLWMRYGNWNGTQIVPEDYLRAATVTNQFVLENEPEEKWMYGHGFWCNDHGKLWPDCPKASFAASGGGGKHIWVYPALEIVIVQNPGLWDQFQPDPQPKRATYNETIARILEALT